MTSLRSAHCFAHALFMLLDEDEASATATPRVRRMRRSSAKSRDEEEDEDDDPTDAGPEDGHLLVAGCVRALQETADLYPSAGLPMVLRFLLEGALESKFARLFGGKFVSPQEKQEEGGARSKNFPHFTSLLEENMNFGSTPTHPLGTATVFHAGTIGRGRREGNNSDRRPPLKRAQVEYNQFAFLCAVFKICHGQSGANAVDRSRDACRHLALLLVDMVSPDVMYNGLPWPDEDFARVTIERDLKIDKSFEDHPLLWKLMLALAEARPALCYCSVLLRALMATQINFWQASVARRAQDYPKQLST